MGVSDIINIVLSVVTVAVALYAVFQTRKQIELSNKQQLFDRRLKQYNRITTLLRLIKDNRSYIEDDEAYLDSNPLLFAWLTNCIELEEMGYAINEPIPDNQKKLLTIHEQLKKSAVEIKMIFSVDLGQVLGEFVNVYADFLMILYKQNVYIKTMNEHYPAMMLEAFETKSKEKASGLGLFSTREKLLTLYDEICKKQLIDKMEEKMRLV